MSFEGQVAIVTGGARGIGFAVASELAKRGAAVAIADIDEECASWASSRSNNTIYVKTDVSDKASVEHMLSAVLAWKRPVHILVHCAGIGLEKPFLETQLEEWQRLINVDLTGTFLCGQVIAAEMVRNRYGRILNIASTAALRGGAGRAAYGAAKGGVVTLTKVMAVELAKEGVTVNALAPGAIETELVAKMHSDKTREVYRRSIPMNRYGVPAETAAAAAFLVSREAQYITGQILGVDGGFLAAGIIHEQ